MKGLAIIALIFAAVSLIIPIVGKEIAILCSIFAIISFRSETNLGATTFGINIINTAFLTPSLFFVEDETLSSIDFNQVLSLDPTILDFETYSWEVYFLYLGIHVVLFFIAVIWRLIRGPIIAPKDV